MTPDDRRAIAAIERAAFSDPWPVEAFDSLLGPYALAAESGGEVVGYVIGRPAADEGEVLNLAVRPDCRRQGVARRLMDELLGRLAGNGVDTLYLEVRASNEGACHFYGALGFEIVWRRRRYYRQPAEDALVMRRRISAGEGHAKE